MLSEVGGSYPVKTLVVQAVGGGDAGWQARFAAVVTTALTFMQQQDIAHNVSIGDHGRSVYIYPRQKNDNFDNGGLNCATFELNGQVFCKRRDAYDTLTLDTYFAHLKAQVDLDDARYEAVRSTLLNTISRCRVVANLQAQLDYLHRKNAALHKSRRCISI